MRDRSGSVESKCDSCSGQAIGIIDVTVTLQNGESATLVNAIGSIASGQRVIFATSTTQTGDLGGVAGADAICAARALAGGIPGTFQAWIGTASISPASRYPIVLGAEFVTSTGAQIATDFADLVDGGIATAIDKDENGATVSNPEIVWTAVNAFGGGPGGGSCGGDWTSTSGNGGRGLSNQTNSFWTTLGTRVCSTQARLYCIQE